MAISLRFKDIGDKVVKVNSLDKKAEESPVYSSLSALPGGSATVFVEKKESKARRYSYVNVIMIHAIQVCEGNSCLL